MEPSEMKRDNVSVEKLEVINLTSDIMSDSVCIKEATDKRYSENSGAMRAFPTESIENNPKEKPAKGRKKKGVRSVFRSVSKAAKRLFHRRDPDRVVHPTPQTETDDSDPRPIRNTPTADKDPVIPVCLPGQVCEDVCVPEPSRTERILDTDSELSPVADLGYEKPAKGRKKKGVRSVFRSVWKGAKRLLHRRDPDRVVNLTLQPETDDSDPRPIRNTPTADKDPVVPVCLPGQVCEDVCVPEPSRTERILDTDSEPSPVADLEIPKQRKERSRSHAFFRRVLKAIKKPFSSRRPREESPAPHESDPEPAAVPDLIDWRPNPEPWDELYDLGDSLGKGRTAEAFKAIRKSDGQEVAIKEMFESFIPHSLKIPGCSRPLPTEVALFLTLRRFPACPYIIQMYEWSDCYGFWISLEYPQPCVTLREFVEDSSERLTEAVASGLMRQLVLAVQHCINCGVFHSDIHGGNILVNPDTLDLKLIDFGFGHLINNAGYENRQHLGALRFWPPQVPTVPTFYAVPANVFKLGTMLYLMVNKELPCSAITEACPPAWKASVSDACYDLICQCLNPNAVKRPTLEQILEHEWFKLDQ